MGALMFSAVIMVPVGTVGIRLLIGAVPVSMCMLVVSFRIYHGKKLIHGSLVMAGCGFFRQHHDMDSESVKNGHKRKCKSVHNAFDGICII